MVLVFYFPKSFIVEHLPIQVYKLSQENTQPENMRDIAFEKTKSRGGTVNRTSVFAEASAWRIL